MRCCPQCQISRSLPTITYASMVLLAELYSVERTATLELLE